MNGSSRDATLLCFPSLHPVLAPGIAAGVRFLDPGLAAPEADDRFLRPDGLPLDRDGLAGFVREFERLRREVKNPKDLALLAGSSGGHFFSDTTFAVREQLEDQLHPERVAARRAQAAQLALCLAYMIEESLLELVGTGELDARFRRGMVESLGLDPESDDDDEAMALAASLAGAGELLTAGVLAEEFRPPWRQVLSPFWAMAPEGAGLFTADPDIAATWIDAGIPLAEPDAAELAGLFPDGAPETPVLAARVTGWRLLGKSRPNPEAPWLDQPRLVVVAKPA